MTTAFLLFYSFSLIWALEVSDPLDILKVKHLLIKNYQGPVNEEVLKLFENVETIESRHCNYTPSRNNFLLSMPKLKKLSLYDSYVHLEQPDDISRCCASLNELVFARSGLDPIPWFYIGQHWPLKSVILNGEKVPKLDAHFLANPHIENLTISDSGIETIDEGAFGKVHLKYLNLQNNKIKIITKEILSSLKSLKYLNLRGNLLSKLTIDQFPSMPNLEKLNVGNNPFKEINLQGIRKVAPKLAEVDISGIEGVDIIGSEGVVSVKRGTS